MENVKNNQKFDTPSFNVIYFDTNDAITTSGTKKEIDLPFVPS